MAKIKRIKLNDSTFEVHPGVNVVEYSDSGAFAEGYETVASGIGSHAEGGGTSAIGTFSHAGGNGSYASGENSFAHGLGVSALKDNQVVIGSFNQPVDNATLIIGNGSEDNASNAVVVLNDGSLSAKQIKVSDEQYVKYNEAQQLTSAQQTQARTNINAASETELTNALSQLNQYVKTEDLGSVISNLNQFLEINDSTTDEYIDNRIDLKVQSISTDDLNKIIGEN